MAKTMQEASEEVQSEETQAEEQETVGTEAEVQAESSTTDTTEDQVVTEDQASEGEQQSVSDEEQTTATTDFDPIAFIDSLPVENLSEDQKKVLKDGFLRQSDYTKKTQALAEERKLIDEYRSLKPYIDKVFQDENLYAQVFGEQKEKPVNQEADSEIPDDPVEYAKWVKEQTKNEIREEMRQENLARAMEADRVEASKLDPRLNTDQEFAEEIAGIVALDRTFLEGKKTAVQATQEALEKYKAREAKYRSRFNNDLQTKIKEKKMVIPRTGNAPLNTSSGGTSPQSMAEAAEMAEKELLG